MCHYFNKESEFFHVEDFRTAAFGFKLQTVLYVYSDNGEKKREKNEQNNVICHDLFPLFKLVNSLIFCKYTVVCLNFSFNLDYRD